MTGYIGYKNSEDDGWIVSGVMYEDFLDLVIAASPGDTGLRELVEGGRATRILMLRDDAVSRRLALVMTDTIARTLAENAQSADPHPRVASERLRELQPLVTRFLAAQE